MSKSQEIEPQLLTISVQAVKSCWEEGSPVAGSNYEIWEQVANVGLRRIRSFDRRHVSPTDKTAQIKDIAEGLIEALESDRMLVGPLIEDYKYVASVLLTAVGDFNSER